MNLFCCLAGYLWVVDLWCACLVFCWLFVFELLLFGLHVAGWVVCLVC